jgi:hypothetical protein
VDALVNFLQDVLRLLNGSAVRLDLEEFEITSINGQNFKFLRRHRRLIGGQPPCQVSF